MVKCSKPGQKIPKNPVNTHRETTELARLTVRRKIVYTRFLVSESKLFFLKRVFVLTTCLYRKLLSYKLTVKLPCGSQKKVMRTLSLKNRRQRSIVFPVGKAALLLDDGHLYLERKGSRQDIVTCQAVVPKPQWSLRKSLRSVLLECGKKGNNLFSAQM